MLHFILSFAKMAGFSTSIVILFNYLLFSLGQWFLAEGKSPAGNFVILWKKLPFVNLRLFLLNFVTLLL